MIRIQINKKNATFTLRKIRPATRFLYSFPYLIKFGYFIPNSVESADPMFQIRALYAIISRRKKQPTMVLVLPSSEEFWVLNPYSSTESGSDVPDPSTP
jgi:hypothetical protein